MSTLAIIAIVVGTLVFACLFDHFFTRILGGDPPKDSVEYLRKIADEIEPKSFKRRRMMKKWKSAIENLMIWKQKKN